MPQYPIHPDGANPFEIRFQDHAPMKTLQTLPRTGSLEQYLFYIGDQGTEGSCSAMSGCQIMSMSWYKKHGQKLRFSEQMLYEVERFAQGDPQEDTGARLRVTQYSLQTVGVCLEALDPNTPEDFLVRLTPAMLQDAAQHKIAHGYAAPSTLEILNALDQGYVPQLGIQVHQSFESPEVAKTGRVPMPRPTEGDTLLGGHAVAAIAYNLDAGWVKAANSWGAPWGDHGCFYLPLAYLDHYLLSARVYDVI